MKQEDQLTTYKTNDGSISLISGLFGESFHSVEGAHEESKRKFIRPAELERFYLRKQIKVLDICVGIGYNLIFLIEQASSLNILLDWTGLEINKDPLRLMLNNDNFLETISYDSVNIISSLVKFGLWGSVRSKGRIIWGDARTTIRKINESDQFDLIFLDPFSPRRCPELWTEEFILLIADKLTDGGRLITYSSSAAVRASMINANLHVQNIYPIKELTKQWSSGTLAIKNKLGFQKDLRGNGWGPLSQMEREHLLTNAAIPYRDPKGNASREEIIEKRKKEQLNSTRTSTSAWKYKWEGANSL